jgi:hypothetical protein
VVNIWMHKRKRRTNRNRLADDRQLSARPT